MITLEEITPDNHQEIRSLKVKPHQTDFVATVEQSLADAYVWSDSEARAAYKNGAAIGFVLIFPFDKDGKVCVNIVRLLVDADHQGMGLGRALLEATLEWIDSKAPDLVRISTVPENEIALHLYKQMGFVESGIEEGEIALYMNVDGT